MNEQELAKQIVQHLNSGLGQIKQGTLYQLQSARKAALDRHKAVPQSALVPVWAGNIAFKISHSPYFNARNLFAVGLLVLGLLGAGYWQVVLQGNDIADIDASLLSEELPIDAYLDSGFEAWLKRSSQ
jgi:hypothetical protein